MNDQDFNQLIESVKEAGKIKRENVRSPLYSYRGQALTPAMIKRLKTYKQANVKPSLGL